MNIKRSFGASVLFDRRPASATVALSLASLSALAALYQGITTLLSVSGYYFDFIYLKLNEDVSWRMGFVATLWAILELLVIFLALQPRPLARLAVIAMVGFKLVALLSLNQSSLPAWQYVLLLAFHTAPIVLLLTRSSNNYYSLK
jgi:hypothetical protein